MKKLSIKRFIIFLLILVLIASIVFIIIKVKKHNSKPHTYEISISDFFPSVEGKVLNYSGSAEYGETVTVNKIIKANDKKFVYVKGKIIQNSKKDYKEKPLDYLYELNKNYVTLNVKNNPKQFSQSIINPQIILKTPIKKNTSWEYKTIINSKEYTYKSTIINISQDSNGKKLLKVQTIINNIPNYPKNTYREFKTYKEGIGLYEFENTLLLEDPRNPNNFTPFDFKYTFFEK